MVIFMKKFGLRLSICIIVLFMLILPALAVPDADAMTLPGPGITVKPSITYVLVNGNLTPFESYNIYGANYFKLRDIACALNKTPKQFDVAWDEKNQAIKLKTNQAYTPVGGEMAVKTNSQPRIASPSITKVFVNDKESQLSSYNIDGSAYFKLRDIAAAVDFGVTWYAVTSTIGIDLSSQEEADIDSAATLTELKDKIATAMQARITHYSIIFTGDTSD